MDTLPRGVALLAVLAVAAAGTAATPGAVATERGSTPPCAGTIERPATGVTVVSIQGANGMTKTTARQIAYGPEGEVIWMNPAGNNDVVWSYDVDPMENGNLFVTATSPGRTLLYELDPETNRRVWSENLDLVDTHDADLLENGRILLANMRNYNESTGVNEDRILVYDRETDEVVWEWHFADHYPVTVGGHYEEDWTHVNDVDRIGPGRYLVSPRNLDQVIVVDRSSGEVDLRLGRYGDHRILNEQHNPDYLETADGDPTMLVGDSENDRVVEYTRTNGTWERTWSLGDRSTFYWPRDADRLPSGNTLVTDSRNNRVLEVTPGGRVVWEVYTPWLPYDAERVRYGDGSNGPTILDQDAAGNPPLRGSAGGHTDESTMEACATLVDGFDGDGLRFTVEPNVTWTTTTGSSDDSHRSTGVPGSPERSTDDAGTPERSTGESGAVDRTTGGFGSGFALSVTLVGLALGALLALTRSRGRRGR